MSASTSSAKESPERVVTAPHAGTEVKRAMGERFDLTSDLTDQHRLSGTLLVPHAATSGPGGCIRGGSGKHRQQRTRDSEDYAPISRTAF